jgi:hypothetical protein
MNTNHVIESYECISFLLQPALLLMDLYHHQVHRTPNLYIYITIEPQITPSDILHQNQVTLT